MRGLSDSEPTRIRTSGMSGGVFEDRVVLLALLGRVAGVGNQALHLTQIGAIRRAGGRDDVLLHHQRAEIVRAEAQRHLPTFIPIVTQDAWMFGTSSSTMRAIACVLR